MKKYFKQKMIIGRYSSGCNLCLAFSDGCLVNYRICKTIAKRENTFIDFVEGLDYEEIF